MISPQPPTFRRTERRLNKGLELILAEQCNWVLPSDPVAPLWLLHIAADTKNLDLAQLVLDANPECLNAFIPADGTTRRVPIGTALHHAAENGFVEMVQFLLTKGADRHLVDQDGNTPLLVALSTTNEVVQGAGFVVNVPCVDLNLVSILLARDHDAPADLQERFRNDAVNALHYATQLSSTAIVTAVLASGVDINSRDSTQSTALHGAVRVAGSAGAQQVVALLISNGSDVNAKDADGRTALFYTCTYDLTRLLLEHGASVREVDRDGRSALDHVRDSQYLPERDSILALLWSHSASGNVATDNTRRLITNRRTRTPNPSHSSGVRRSGRITKKRREDTGAECS